MLPLSAVLPIYSNSSKKIPLASSHNTLNFITNIFIKYYTSQLAGGRADDGENEDEDDEDDVDEVEDQVMPLGECE